MNYTQIYNAILNDINNISRGVFNNVSSQYEELLMATRNILNIGGVMETIESEIPYIVLLVESLESTLGSILSISISGGVVSLPILALIIIFFYYRDDINELEKFLKNKLTNIYEMLSRSNEFNYILSIL